MFAIYVWVLWRPERGVESSGTGVIGIWESSSVDARNQAQTLSKSHKCSYLMSLLSSSLLYF